MSLPHDRQTPPDRDKDCRRGARAPGAGRRASGFRADEDGGAAQGPDVRADGHRPAGMRAAGDGPERLQSRRPCPCADGQQARRRSACGRCCARCRGRQGHEQRDEEYRDGPGHGGGRQGRRHGRRCQAAPGASRPAPGDAAATADAATAGQRLQQRARRLPPGPRLQPCSRRDAPGRHEKAPLSRLRHGGRGPRDRQLRR